MGVSLAEVVLSAHWGHLPLAPEVLFAHMAITARDEPVQDRLLALRGEHPYGHPPDVELVQRIGWVPVVEGNLAFCEPPPSPGPQ